MSSKLPDTIFQLLPSLENGKIMVQKQTIERAINAQEGFHDCAQALASEKESKIVESDDGYIVIDGMKLDKKMETIGISKQ